jgi:predicted alpha/beta hydrolase
MLAMKRIEIKTAKGYGVSAQLYEAQMHSVLIIASATGVKQGFYQKFAEYISEQGTTVITFDYYGIGVSLTAPIKSVSVTAAEWGSNDLEAVIQWARDRYVAAGISILGHSIGGQLIGLAPSATYVNRIVLVAAQTGYWMYWPGVRKFQMWANWYLLFPVLTRIAGYMPSRKFSGIENLPAKVALQWSKWCRSSNYLFDDLSISELYFHKIAAPVVAISIDQDPFAPKKAVDWFTEKYNSKMFKSFHLKPGDYKVQEIGHFGVFKEKFKSTIWELLRNELVL